MKVTTVLLLYLIRKALTANAKYPGILENKKNSYVLHQTPWLASMENKLFKFGGLGKQGERRFTKIYDSANYFHGLCKEAQDYSIFSSFQIKFTVDSDSHPCYEFSFSKENFWLIDPNQEDLERFANAFPP